MANTIPPTLGLTRPGPSNAPKITFAAKDIDVLEWNGDLLAVGVTEKDVVRDENSNFKNPLLRKLDASLGGLLAEASSEEDFSGKSGQSVVLRVSGLSFKRVGLFGLGQSASTAAAFLGLGEAIAAAAKASRAISVAVALAFSEDLSDESKPEIASAIALGIVIGIFDDNRYRSDPKLTVLQSVDVLGLGSGPDVDKKLKYAQNVSSGIVFVRELVNSPANILTPGALAAEVLKITQKYNDVLSARIFNEEEIIEMKMGSYLGVTAAATANPPKFIHLCYKPPSGPQDMFETSIDSQDTFLISDILKTIVCYAQAGSKQQQSSQQDTTTHFGRTETSNYSDLAELLDTCFQLNSRSKERKK